VGTYQEEPRESRAEEHLEVFPLAVVVAKIAPRSLWNLKILLCLLLGSNTGNLVNICLTPLTRAVSLNISSGLLNVLLYVESVSRRFGDGKTD
jgi:hypothetical protein